MGWLIVAILFGGGAWAIALLMAPSLLMVILWTMCSFIMALGLLVSGIMLVLIQVKSVPFVCVPLCPTHVPHNGQNLG